LPHACNMSRWPSILIVLSSGTLVSRSQHLQHIDSELGSFGKETRSHGGTSAMRSGRFEQLVRLGAGALMVLMVHGVCAPTTARADCSHRVGLRSAAISSLYGLDELIGTGNSSISGHALAQSPHDRPVPGPRVPCSGLSCSSQVPLPVSSVVAGSDGSDQRGALVALMGIDTTSLPDRRTDECVSHSAGEGSSIFHPPRA
jgi:hypothetical protein